MKLLVFSLFFTLMLFVAQAQYWVSVRFFHIHNMTNYCNDTEILPTILELNLNKNR